MGGSPSPQTPKIPAKSPTRAPGVAPEDIVLGGLDNTEDSLNSIKGKRSLIKPTGFLSGVNMQPGG